MWSKVSMWLQLIQLAFCLRRKTNYVETSKFPISYAAIYMHTTVHLRHALDSSKKWCITILSSLFLKRNNLVNHNIQAHFCFLRPIINHSSDGLSLVIKKLDFLLLFGFAPKVRYSFLNQWVLISVLFVSFDLKTYNIVFTRDRFIGCTP